MQEVYLVAGVRTAVGTFGGALKDHKPSELGAAVTREALARAGIAPAEIGHVAFGQVIHTEPADAYISRVCAVNAGIPVEVPAITVNRLCGSGLQAIVTAAQYILLGDADITVAGGVEVMSRAPYQLSGVRWGTRLGDTPMVDMVLGALTDPFGQIHMGITAENVAARYEITRKQQDEAAVTSHRRAARAIAEGRFKDQILPIPVKRKRETVDFDTDEHVRADATIEEMRKLRPAFRRDGSVTAGNASGINDGAAAVVLASGEAVR